MHLAFGRGTSFYVTREQIESKTVTDRAVVLSKGSTTQQGSRLEFYRGSNNTFVAGPLGLPAMNL